MKQREQWGSRIGFILAAVGSAIGLGNIWRFPYMTYENGGGAFLVPYLFAMLTAGIPLMILEFGVGHKYRGAAPKTFASISAKWEWLGWWQILISMIISIYYVAVIGWAICYLFLSATQAWGTDTADFFFKSFLQLSDSPLQAGHLQWGILAAIAACWFINWVALSGGIRKGIEVANKIFMPLLFILILVIVARAVTLPGAADGINWMFKPDFSKILDYKTWTAAYGQIFFSLSVGFGIMITYSSYLPKDSDINNNAFMAVFINCGFSMLAGVMVFAVLGNMAMQKGVPVSEVVSSGVGLAFITIPQAINMLPAPVLFGLLFFAAICVAGLSSEISINETVISSIMDKTGIGRRKVVTSYCIFGLVVSSIFATGGGLLILDIVDHFINNFGIVMTGLVEIIFLAWLCSLEKFRQHVNTTSEFPVGKWWDFCLKYITPLVLGYMAVANIIGDISKPYGGYSFQALLTLGWFIVIIIVPLAFLLQKISPRSELN